jgi:inward rectifier potassium channel
MNDQIPGQNVDLGLGSKVIQENENRLVNKDGSFTMKRKGVFNRGAFSPYHAILKTTWPRFYFSILGYLLSLVFIFSLLFLACGPHAFFGIENISIGKRFIEIIFFSIQILSAGASPIYPIILAAKIIQGAESVIGLLGFALAAGLVFARFSNPSTKIIFSKNAVITPYKDLTALIFRIINGRSNELVQLSVSLVVVLRDHENIRRFHPLTLERSEVDSFAVNWTIVHPIDEQSPLFHMSQDEFIKSQPEFVVSLTAVDEDLSKQVYVRHSYLGSEVVFGKKFKSILEHDAKGNLFVDPSRIHELEKV